jgi:hypothetical protein
VKSTILPSILAGAVGLSCASAPPTPSNTIEPVQAGAAATSPARPAGSGGPEDQAFVLSRKPTATPPKAAPIDLHIADRWWRFRGDYLHINENQARARDSEISEVQAPDRFWDEQSAVEAINLWSAVCNECHGGRRKLEDAMKMPVPAPDWGRGEGLFFGARRRYADVFMTIYRGGPERNGVRSEMPPWRGKISKELIWALLYFLEYQSGGIEGRFPPSLYPRRETVE